MNGKWKVKAVQNLKYEERFEGECETYEEAVALCKAILSAFPETEFSIKFSQIETNHKAEDNKEEDK